MLEMIRLGHMIRPSWQMASRTRRHHYDMAKNVVIELAEQRFHEYPSGVEEIQDIVEKDADR